MSNPQDTVSSKGSSSDKGESKPIESASPENIYLSAVKALSAELKNLRADEPVLNKLERTSIDALISYTAYMGKAHEAVVRSMVETRFCADAVAKIHHQEYDEVIRYLLDLNVNEAVN
jgi:hypothetical protein